MSFFVPEVLAASSADALGRVLQPILTNIVNPVVGLIFVIAVVVFAYGIFQMIWKGGDPDAREAGKSHMLYGLIGMFIMVSAWGIIYLIANTVKQI